MQYLASHYWQSADEHSVSLLLQQVYHKRKQLPVLMACVCTDENITTKLVDWFWKIGLPLSVRKGEAGIEKVRKKLENYLKRENISAEGVSLSGVFCVGNMLFFWRKGQMRIRLMNERNFHAQMTEVELGEDAEKRMVFRSGVIQSGVGLLLGTSSFEEWIVGMNPAEYPDVRMLYERGHLEECLQKLGNAAVEKGGKNVGAILIVAR